MFLIEFLINLLSSLAWWRVFNKSEILLPKVVCYDFLWAFYPSWKSSLLDLAINFPGPSWQPHGHQHGHLLQHQGDDWKKTINYKLSGLSNCWCSLWWHTWTPRAGWCGASATWPPPSWWQQLIFATWSLDYQGESLTQYGDTSGPPYRISTLQWTLWRLHQHVLNLFCSQITPL